MKDLTPFVNITGIIVPLITPFQEDGSIDKESFGRLINHIIPSGINGVFPCSTTGEFQYLSPEEKFEAIEIVIKAVRGRVPVFAGVTGRTMEETISNIKHVERLRPDAIVIAPLVYRSNRKLPQHMERIQEMTGLPIILYNNDELIRPPLRRENIRTNILKRVSRLNSVVGLKDSSGDMRRLANYLRAVRDRKDFSILVGDESKIIAGLKIGAKGGVPSLANVFPELFVRLYGLFRADFQEACRLQEEVVRLRNAFYHKKKIRGGLKASLYIKGIIRSNLAREPGQALTEFQESSIENFLR